MRSAVRLIRGCSGPPLLITSHDLLSSFVKFQLIAHLLHGCSERLDLFFVVNTSSLATANARSLKYEGAIYASVTPEIISYRYTYSLVC